MRCPASRPATSRFAIFSSTKLTTSRLLARFFGAATSHLVIILVVIGVLHAEELPSEAQSHNRELALTLFSPQGIAPNVRQIRATFSDDMIAFADPRVRADIFSVACSGTAKVPSGTARWADTRTWVYDFEKDLPSGVRCIATSLPSLLSHDGRSVTLAKTYEFSSGGPMVTQVMPWPGSEIAEDQAFIVQLNGEVDTDSLLEHSYFTSSSLESQIPARLLSNSDLHLLLTSQYIQEAEQKNSVFIGIKPSLRLAPGSKLHLHWGAGVASPSGESSPQDQQFQFLVRRPFGISVECERTNAKAGCIPFRPISIAFSSPAELRKAKAIRLQTAQGDQFLPEVPDEDKRSQFIDRIQFRGPFSADSELSVILPQNIRDDGGRRLPPQSESRLRITIGGYPPLVKFASSFGVIEWLSPTGTTAPSEAGAGATQKVQTHIPVTVRGIEPELLTKLLSQRDILKFTSQGAQSLPLRVARVRGIPEIIRWINLTRWHSTEDSIFSQPATPQQSRPQAPPAELSTLRLQAPHGGSSFEVMGIPVHKPGFYVVEVESPNLARAYRSKEKRFFVTSSALVTNLSPHFKWGKDKSLAWVTALDSGKPVPDASLAVSDCTGTILWQGRSDKDGLAYPTKLPESSRDHHRCPGVHGLFLSVERGEDFAFTSSAWDEGIEPWRFGFPTEYSFTPLLAHTVISENLARRGNTVHLKHYLRQRGSNGLRFAPSSQHPAKVSLKHQGSDETFEFPLRWNKNGSAETTWEIPRNAKLGSYSILLTFNPSSKTSNLPSPIVSGSLSVEDFRVPLMQAQVKVPTEIQVRPTSLTHDVSLRYLAGGAAGGMSVVTRSVYQNLWVEFGDEHQGFSFLSGPVTEGVFRSGSLYPEGGDDDSSQEPALPRGVINQNVTLDGTGAGRITIEPSKNIQVPYQLATELEYRDPNGEIQTVRASSRIWPSEIALGIRPKSWAENRGRVAVQAIALSPSGAPLPGQKVSLSLFQSKVFSHRKRLVGGFYGYENVTDRQRVQDLCSGETDASGLLDCDVEVNLSGEVLVEARTTDRNGHAAVTHTSLWILGGERTWFEQDQDDRIDVLANKKVYERGETATLQVRSPFPNATALISVEREGVLDAFVQEVSGHSPIIHVPIRDNYAPNVYVSVLLTRGRVGDIQPTALLDLGKPALKLGIAELKVSRLPHSLHVKVQTDKEIYQARETALAKIIVQHLDGSPLSGDVDVAIVAVDEGLLELQDNQSWNLLDGMLGRRALGVRTSSAQLQVIGKRHFGLKALPVGGGGGKGATRELFDTLLLWKGSVPLSRTGVAEVAIPLNDSLSRFRVVAVATSGENRFGSGHASFATTQDLMILPGIAPFAREGDRTTVEATLRNTTERTIATKLLLSATRTSRTEGKEHPASIQTNSETRTLAPGASDRVRWEIVVPNDASSIQYEIEAGEESASRDGEAAVDRVRVRQEIGLPHRPSIIQASLHQIDKDLEIPIDAPADRIVGHGGISVSFAPSLLTGTEGLSKTMEEYPYTCLEQRVSRAVVLGNQKDWENLQADFLTSLDEQGLLKFFPTGITGSATLTAYVVSIAHAAGLPIAESPLKRMLGALSRVASGSQISEEIGRPASLSQERIAVLDALSRHGQADLMVIQSIPIDLRLLPTASLAQWWSVLERSKGKDPGLEGSLAAVQREVLSRLEYQGSMLTLSSGALEQAWWLMSSADRAVNELLANTIEFGSWSSDTAKLVRGALARQQDGAWDLTTANAWGAVMLKNYSKRFERTPVSGRTTASLRSVEPLRLEVPTPVTSPPAVTAWADRSAARGGTSTLLAFPNSPSVLSVQHRGAGAPWAFIRSIASLPQTAPISSGFTINRRLIPIKQAKAGIWSEGDMLRIRLSVDAQADRNWTVIEDPVPAGATILGTTRRTSHSLSENATPSVSESKDEIPAHEWITPVFVEREFGSYRAYYDYVPKGRIAHEYTIRLNLPGEYALPSTRVEAMYSPEMFGELPNEPLQVHSLGGAP